MSVRDNFVKPLIYNLTMKTYTLLILTFLSSLSFAIEIGLNSGQTQTQVVELYTSEGCSSCPPADRWLTSLKSNPKLFKSFVPVAFHVDYWDYIGWKDELALPQNSNRQRQHKFDNNINSVYTPGVLKAGKEWRRWNGVTIEDSADKVGSLNLEIMGNNLNAHFDSVEKGEFKLVVALLGMNIETKVLSGENKGEILRHDFVVLNVQSFQANQGTWKESIGSEFFESNHKNTAFVAWVEKTDNPAPVQAVGTYL